MKAVVMAGGEGTRLRPLTCNVPKPMVPVMDKPVIDYTFHLLKQHGITDVAVTLHYLPTVIQDYFGDGSSWGIKLRYFIEKTPLGTAGSVKNAEEFLDETFLVISGDALTDFPLSEAIAFHRARGALATIVLTRVDSPLEYGLVLTDRQGRIYRFLEKPSWGEVFSDTVNTGIYILEPEVLRHIPAGEPFDFSRDLFPLFLDRREPLFGCVLRGYWCDIGNHFELRQVHFDILDGKVGLEVEGERAGNIWLGKGARISSRVRLEGPAFIGSDCHIEAGAHILPYTVLGSGTVVEDGASLKKTIVGRGCYIGPRSELRGVVLGQGVKCKQFASAFEGAVIGDGCVLEEGVVVKPEVKIWPHKHIEARQVLAESIVWAKRQNRVLFTSRGIRGDLNGSLSLERLVRLGRALGSYLPVNSRVAVACDWSREAALGRQAFVAGLIASGIKVSYMGSLLAPAWRYVVREIGFDCGVFFTSADEGQILNVRLIDRHGIDLLKSEERKIENLFHREEYRPVVSGIIGDQEFVPGVMEAYLTSVLRNLNRDAIKRSRFRVVVGADENKAGEWLSYLMDRLGIDVMRMDGLGPLSRKIHSTGASLGVYLMEAGENVWLVTGKGEVIKDERLLDLVLRSFAAGFNRVFLPVSAPLFLEGAVQSLGKEVIRTRAVPSEFMKELLRAEELEQLRLYTDGPYLTVKLLEVMACRYCSLEDLLEDQSVFFYEKKEVPVAWAEKGKVIRRLAAEMALTDSPQALEGVRIFHPDGSGLILPDEERPVCRVYAESFSQETAESIADFCIEKIRMASQEQD